MGGAGVRRVGIAHRALRLARLGGQCPPYSSQLLSPKLFVPFDILAAAGVKSWGKELSMQFIEMSGKF